MGESHSSAQFAAKIASVAPGIVAANRRAIKESSLTVKTAVQTRMRAATGGDLILSGLSRGRANAAGSFKSGRSRTTGSGRIGVRYDVKGSENPTSLVRATGPAHLVENDTKRHDIKPRGRGRRRGAGALTINGGLYASAKNTGGSKGRHPWRDGVRAATPVARAQFLKAQRTELAKRFK